MQIVPDKCPTCGGDPDLVEESIIVHTGIKKKEDGSWDWSPEDTSEVFWDSAEPVATEDGKNSVRCGECDCFYDAEIKPDEEEEDDGKRSEAGA